MAVLRGPIPGKPFRPEDEWEDPMVVYTCRLWCPECKLPVKKILCQKDRRFAYFHDDPEVCISVKLPVPSPLLTGRAERDLKAIVRSQCGRYPRGRPPRGGRTPPII